MYDYVMVIVLTGKVEVALLDLTPNNTPLFALRF